MKPAPKSKSVQSLLYVYEGGYLTCRRRLSGIYKVTTPLGIRVELMDVHAVTDLKMVLDFWKPDGVIAEGDAMTKGWARLLSSRKIPTVLCDPKPEEADAQGCHLIMHNSRDTARLAVRELLSLGYASYGCVEYWDAYDWSDLRVAEFEETVRKAGSPGKVFRSCAECKKGDVRVFLSRISEFIASLPKPCGIFAVNDEMAMNVMSAALMSGYNIPHDVAIASIDNDELLCDNAPVSLSSIAPDFEKSGRLAAELLLKTIDRPDLPLVVDHYGAAPLVRRKSTSVFKVRMHGVIEALEAIRTQYAHAEFDVDSVVSIMDCSRRSAETRFLKSTGETIGAAIRRRRLEAAEQLLQDDYLSISSIAARCGFADVGTFQKAFQRAHGQSPTAWRAQR